MNSPAFDLFISHAWENKDDFVRPLANRLIETGLKVWYDELSLELGDSLRVNIDKGLADSKFGLVVLSPSFFAKHWPERELNGLVQKASIEGRKVILPVWHNVDHAAVAQYSLPLADLLAAQSHWGVDRVAAEVLKVVQRASGVAISTREIAEEFPPSSTNASSPSVSQAEKIHEVRASYSLGRLTDLRTRFSELAEISTFPNLTVFATGSYGRLEASKHSDIDLFFVSVGERQDLEEPRTKELRLFGKVIDTVDQLEFPKFSNDCQYLVILHSGEIVHNLGSPVDDHQNFFTARMLLLLESRCLYGDEVYEKLMVSMVEPYFRDYPDHKHTFQPVFLLNDICRYWKTLLLNYEHKRSIPTDSGEHARTQQKVRNFKLKYSRMTTCFASIGALGSHLAPVREEHVLALTKLTPRERLETIAEAFPAARGAVQEVLGRYNWFLEMTGLSVAELEDHFSDKQRRTEMFQQANEYGDAMYRLLQALDASNDKLRLLRYLVI